MIIFCDLNNSLVEKVRAVGIESYHDDYFRRASEIQRAVMMTASNPQFTFGGGIDAIFTENFPYYCQLKKMRRVRGMERIGNIVFAITVNNDYKADKETVKKAIQFALDNTYEGETLVLSGVGTGIGGLSEDDFVEILSSITSPNEEGK